MALDKMGEQFKDFAELKSYSDAQNKTILEQSRKLRERDEEIKHLKKLLEGAVPLIKEKKTSDKLVEGNDQEYICRVEINKLKSITEERELTLEECKRFDIYSKILKELANVPKTIEINTKGASEQELLAVIAGGKIDG